MRDFREEDVAFHSEGAHIRGTLTVPTMDGRRPAVIWSHGYGGYSNVLGAPLVKVRLVERGFVFLAIDHRGCGASQASPRGRCVQGIESVLDLVHAITYVRSRPDVDGERIGLVGESHGGATVLMSGALDDRVRAVVATDAFADGRAWLAQMWEKKAGLAAFDRLMQKTAEALRTEVLTGVITHVPVPEVIPYGETELQLVHQLWRDHPLWSRDASLATVESIGLLAPLCVAARLSSRRVRLIHGEDDSTVPVDDATKLHQAIPRSDLRVLRGVGHGVTFSDRSTEVLDLIEEWFEHSLSDQRVSPMTSR